MNIIITGSKQEFTMRVDGVLLGHGFTESSLKTWIIQIMENPDKMYCHFYDDKNAMVHYSLHHYQEILVKGVAWILS